MVGHIISTSDLNSIRHENTQFRTCFIRARVRSHRTPNQTNTQYTAQRRIIWMFCVFSFIVCSVWAICWSAFVVRSFFCVRACVRWSHTQTKERQRSVVYFCLHYAFHMDKIVLFLVGCAFFLSRFLDSLVLSSARYRMTSKSQKISSDCMAIRRFDGLSWSHKKRRDKKKHRSVLINQHFIAQRL